MAPSIGLASGSSIQESLETTAPITSVTSSWRNKIRPAFALTEIGSAGSIRIVWSPGSAR